MACLQQNNKEIGICQSMMTSWHFPVVNIDIEMPAFVVRLLRVLISEIGCHTVYQVGGNANPRRNFENRTFVLNNESVEGKMQLLRS